MKNALIATTLTIATTLAFVAITLGFMVLPINVQAWIVIIGAVAFCVVGVWYVFFTMLQDR